MKKSLQNKLKSYTALSAVVAFGASDANAQMVSTSVNYTGGYESYDIDLDSDGKAEVTLNNQDVISSFASVSWVTGASKLSLSGGNGSFVGYDQWIYAGGWLNFEGYNVSRMSSGDVIASSNYFYSQNSLSSAIVGTVEGAGNMGLGINTSSGNLMFDVFGANIFGDWYEGYGFSSYTAYSLDQVSDGVIGISFDKDGNTHYGWARIDVSANRKKFIVKDFGYEAQADIIAYAEANYTSNYVTLGLSDVDNQLNASDLKMRLTLDKTTTHYNDVDGFHVVLSKASNGDLSVPDALATNGNFISKWDFNWVSTEKSTLDIRPESFDVDSDGDLVEQGVEYNVYVVTQDFAGRPMRMINRSITLTNTLAITELSNDNVTISSNDGVLNVSLNNVSNATITVNDILGKEILSEKTNATSFTSKLDGAAGVYIVTVSNENGQITKKIKL